MELMIIQNVFNYSISFFLLFHYLCLVSLVIDINIFNYLLIFPCSVKIGVTSHTLKNYTRCNKIQIVYVIQCEFDKLKDTLNKHLQSHYETRNFHRNRIVTII